MAKLKDGFYKQTAEAVGSNSYMLLAGGGSKALSDFASASGVVTALGTKDNYVTWTKNGIVNNLTVPYASVAGKLSIGSYDKSSEINFTKVFWTANNVDGDSVTGFGYAAVMNIGSDLYRGWQIWNNRNDHTLYWRPAKSDASTWADVHAILDSFNYTTYTVKKDGTGASGTWDIDISGTASYTNYIGYTSRADKGNGYAQFCQYAGPSNNPTDDWYSHIIMNHSKSAGYYTEIATCFHSDHVYFRRQTGGLTTDWKQFAWTSDIPTVSNANGYVPRFVSFPSYFHFGSSTDTYDYLKNIVKWIYDNANYGGKTYLMGVGNPNSLGMMNIQLYGSDGKNSEGYPRYCSGTFLNLGDSAFEIFGTVDYNYYRYRLSVDGHGHRITKLHRRDASDDYSLQHHWTGSYWYLRGYYGDSYHAGVQVDYAGSAGYAPNSTYLYASDSPFRYGDSASYYMRMRYNVNGDNRWYLSVYPETPKTVAVDYAYSAGNADTLDGYHWLSFVTAGVYDSGNFNTFYNRSFVGSIYATSNSPTGSALWFNTVQIAHRNGESDGSNYISQITIGMTGSKNRMWFRGSRTDAWTEVISSANIGSQSVNYATSSGNADTVDNYHIWAGSSSSLPASRNNNTIYLVY